MSDDELLAMLHVIGDGDEPTQSRDNTGASRGLGWSDAITAEV